MVTITHKKASPFFAVGMTVIPGTHTYDITADTLERFKQEDLVVHNIKAGHTIIDSEGEMTAEKVAAISETASAKELENLVAALNDTREKAMNLSQDLEAETDKKKKADVAAALKVAEDAYKAAETALAKREKELEEKRAALEKDPK